ncbi:MAG: sigma-70 family RNA polymerase sigma factor [Pseudomonadota bacterium]
MSKAIHPFKEAIKRPALRKDQSVELIAEWQTKQDPKLLSRIVVSHQNLVRKIANGYSGYGLPLSDLISEGNIGMMHALKHFDPTRGFRFSTYAVWWIKSVMNEFLVASHSLIRIPKSPITRKLFFKLPAAIHAELSKHAADILSDEMIESISKKLKVPVDEVLHMIGRIKREVSLNTPLNKGESGSDEWQDFIPDDQLTQEHMAEMQDEHKRRTTLLNGAMTILSSREKEVIHSRHFKEPPDTFEVIGQRDHLSRERIRQIEKAALGKMRSYINQNTKMEFDQL